MDFLRAAGLQSDDASPTGGDNQIGQSANKQDTVLTEDLILGGYMCILLGCTIIKNPDNVAIIGQVLRDRAPATDGGADNEKIGATGCAAPLIRVICGFLNFQVFACPITFICYQLSQKPCVHAHTHTHTTALPLMTTMTLNLCTTE